MVAALRPFGEVALTPREFPHSTIGLEHLVLTLIDLGEDTRVIMGRELGLRIIAEGVETERQVDFLLKENCFLMQGYFFYKPMEVTQVQQFLKKNHQNRGTENHK